MVLKKKNNNLTYMKLKLVNICLKLKGREFDRFGNLHQWWNNKTIDRFKKEADCMIKQYSNYKINDYNINGKRTLGTHTKI